MTGSGGVVLLAEVNRVLGVIDAIDAAVGSIRRRRGGVSGGELVFAAAEMMLTGGDFMIDFDHRRVDEAAAALAAAPIPSSSTFGALSRRFGDAEVAGLEAAVGEVVRRWYSALEPARRAALAGVGPTVDLDTTDIEVYGRHKEGVAYNYLGQRAGRVHAAVWAEAGVALAAELGSGVDDPRPQAEDLLRRALAALPEGLARPAVRADSGYHDAALAAAAVGMGCDFAVAVKRNTAVWAAEAAVADDAWKPAIGMPGAQVALCEYRPPGWPPGTRCVVRRVPIPDGDMPTRRSRRRRTIPARQLILGLLGLGPAYAYSFILTNLSGDPADIEAWFRQRALIEERFKDAKLGVALRHLPSGYYNTNRIWMWAALVALNLSTFTQTLARVDDPPPKTRRQRDGRRQRAHGKRLRRELINVPARVVTHARRTVIRPAPTHARGPFPHALTTLQHLPTWTAARRDRPG